MNRRQLLLSTMALATASLLGGVVTQASAADPIKIGFFGSITGPAADLGRPSRDGALLRVTEINAAGGINGRPLELIVYDDETNPAKAVAAVRRMAEGDNVVAIVSGSTTGSTLASLKISQQLEIPHLVVVAQAPIVTRPVNPWTFRITGNFDHEIQRMVTFLEERKVKRLGLLKDSGTVGKEALAALKPKLDAAGIQIVADENVTVNATDVTAQTLNIRRGNPEYVIFYGYGAEAALFGKTMRQIGLNVPVIGNRGLAMPVFLEAGGPAVDGFIITDNYNDAKPLAKTFSDAFVKRYKEKPINSFPALGYDGIGVLAAALKSTPKVDRVSLRAALENLTGYESVTGGPGLTFSFTPEKHDGPTGSPEQIVVMRVAKGGRYTDLK